MSYNTKNYTEQGGDVTHIGGILEFGEGAELSNFPGAENFAPKTTNTAADIRADLNKLITYMKNAGIMIPDEWSISVLACPTPAAMPTTETAANSAHATVTIDDTAITITLNCKVSDLADADHGSAKICRRSASTSSSSVLMLFLWIRRQRRYTRRIPGSSKR